MGVDRRPRAIAVMGPTAAGKTAFAVEVAQRHGGEIVSVDSALVYRGLDIGAAKPDAAERGGIAHHLIDVRDPWQPYSAADFAEEARHAIDGIVARDRLPILVGGTGLYFTALLHGLAPMPDADPAVREQLLQEATAHGWPALHARLAMVDPEAAARIHATDAQRIQRALEVQMLSGKPISQWQREAATQPRFPLHAVKLILAPADRAVLHARIERRFDQMCAAGFLDEVRALRALPALRDYPVVRDLPAIRAVGYRQAWAHLDGETDAATFRAQGIAATRQLAKRQLTWLRAQRDARWFDPQSDHRRLHDAVTQFLPR